MQRSQMIINDIKERFQSFLDSIQQDRHQLDNALQMILDKIETQLKTIIAKLENNIELDNDLSDFLDVVEEFADAKGIDVSELNEDLNEIYHDLKDYDDAEKNRGLKMTPYDVQA